MHEKLKMMSIRTKILLFLIILIVLFITYQATRITTLDEIISDEQVQNLDALNVTIDFIWERKAFVVIEAASVESILDIVSEIKVWPTYFPIDEFRNTIKNSYFIQFQYEKDAKLPFVDLFIYDKNSLSINGKYYKIIGGSELEKIYDLTILAQPADSLDQYYYDLIDSN
jgi:hypothetical protein